MCIISEASTYTASKVVRRTSKANAGTKGERVEEEEEEDDEAEDDVEEVERPTSSESNGTLSAAGGTTC